MLAKLLSFTTFLPILLFLCTSFQTVTSLQDGSHTADTGIILAAPESSFEEVSKTATLASKESNRTVEVNATANRETNVNLDCANSIRPFQATLLTTVQAILSELKAINGKLKMLSNGPSSSTAALQPLASTPANLTASTAPVTAPPPLTEPLIVVSPNRECPSAYRKRLLDGLNFRRFEEGLPLLRVNFSLGREAYALVHRQDHNFDSPHYLAEQTAQYGQFAAGMQHNCSDNINLQWFDFFAYWRGVPVIVAEGISANDNRTTTFKALSEQKWAKTSQVGFACEADMVKNHLNYRKFWVAAFFSGFA